MKRLESANGEMAKAKVGKTVAANEPFHKAIGNQPSCTANTSCSNTAKTKLGIERPKIATNVAVESIQVFLYIAEITPSMIPNDVPNKIA